MKKHTDSLKGSTNAAPLSDDFPRFVIDQSASTVSELKAEWAMGETALRRFIASQVESGRWELVHKRTPRGVISAYRRKQ